MKKIISTLLALVVTVALFAQSDKQVKWSFQTKKVAENTFEIKMTADISGNWHLYAQEAGDGPVATSFAFTKNPLLTLNGNVKELGNVKKVFAR